MPDHRLSRRGFFHCAGASAGLGMASPAAEPPRGWIIVALNWEHNDEFSYVEGDSPQTDLFYDQGAADAECQRLCDVFFNAQTPAQFEIDWDTYLYPDGYSSPDFDEETMTWDEVRAAGFPDPYYVLELTRPGEPSA